MNLLVKSIALLRLECHYFCFINLQYISTSEILLLQTTTYYCRLLLMYKGTRITQIHTSFTLRVINKTCFFKFLYIMNYF